MRPDTNCFCLTWLARAGEDHFMRKQRHPFRRFRAIAMSSAHQFMPAIRPADQPRLAKTIQNIC